MTDIKLPIIVVCSEGAQSSQEVINKLRKGSADENTVELCENTIGHKFHNVTKYYENDIVFLSHESKHINLVPMELLDRIEGCIIYFDAENKDFLHKMPVYANFIALHNIEFGILLCNKLFDNPLDGITYKEAKAYSQILDVIELDRPNENEDEDRSGAASHHDPIGYDELLQAIRAIIWSNVDLKRKPRTNSATQTVPKDSTTETKLNEENSSGVEDTRIDAELAGFEELLNEVMTFKDTTSTWSRTERLAYAEKFAYAFDNLLQNNRSENKRTDNDLDDANDDDSTSSESD